jgi:hypothetical protein
MYIRFPFAPWAVLLLLGLCLHFGEHLCQSTEFVAPATPANKLCGLVPSGNEGSDKGNVIPWTCDCSPVPRLTTTPAVYSILLVLWSYSGIAVTLLYDCA